MPLRSAELLPPRAPLSVSIERRLMVSDVKRSRDTGHRVASEPDRFIVETDADLAVAAEAAPLARDLAACRQHTVAEGTRRDPAVAATYCLMYSQYVGCRAGDILAI